MANWFEDITKTMADEKIGRRTALKRVAGTLAGVAIAAAVPGVALASDQKQCKGIDDNCFTGFVNCTGNPNTNCFCFEMKRGAGHPNGCGCNQFCSQLPLCKVNHDCPAGSFCSYFTGCDCSGAQGYCITTCAGKNKNCTLGAGHGATAAR